MTADCTTVTAKRTNTAAVATPVTAQNFTEVWPADRAFISSIHAHNGTKSLALASFPGSPLTPTTTTTTTKKKKNGEPGNEDSL